MKSQYDLIIVGAGFSGAAAAIAAARRNASVLLIEKGNAPGGAAVNCLVNPYMGYTTVDPETGKVLPMSSGLFDEINAELEKLGAHRKGVFHEEYLKVVLTRMLLKAGVTLLFDTCVTDAFTENGRITQLELFGRSGKQKVSAKYFIDATGDADLAVMAGCPTRLGRDSDRLCQPMTLCFRMVNVDMAKYHADRDRIQALYKEYQAEGRIKNPRENILVFSTLIGNVMHFNTTRVIKRNPMDTEDVTAAEIEAREQVIEMVDFLKGASDAFKDAELIMTASEIGVRESRMIDGEYVITQDDLLALTKFEDGIALCNYDIDIHNPSGSGTSHHYFAAGEFYSIPYRCLVPKGVDNLLVTGRCVSASHEAQASLRIMPTCCSLGEAAGTAAALAIETGCEAMKCLDVAALRKTLVENGNYLV